MKSQRIVIINGANTNSNESPSVLKTLLSVVNSLESNVEVVHLDQKKNGHCVGCYQCWLRTPGLCVQKDAGVEIANTVLNSNLTIFLSPVVFGSYAPVLKRLVDRMLSPLNLPFMFISNGETHHLPRYPQYPRLIGIGIQSIPDPAAEKIFKILVGRNALQMHAPTFAASVVNAAEDPDRLRLIFQALMTRTDPWPRQAALQELRLQEVLPLSWQPQPGQPGSSQRVLLLSGSPKAKRSTGRIFAGSPEKTRLPDGNLETQSGWTDRSGSAGNA